MCYGDSLLTVGLTHMALLFMESDTNYITYWLDEMQANANQRKAMTFYTLLFCIDFMGEQGMSFDNGKTIQKSQDKINILNEIYNELMNEM
jgi:hypothetical protein